MFHIRVDGLADLRRALRDAEQPEDLRELRAGLRRAAEVVADEAKSRVPVRSGRARDSLRPSTSGNRAYVVGGKASVPYFGWLDFGSRNPRTGNSRSVGPWSGSGQGPERGRFIYPALDAKERQVVELIEEALNDALDRLDLI